MTKLLTFDAFPVRTTDKVRYSDTDRQGHVNNAVFATFCETGRVELLLHMNLPLLSKEVGFVLASMRLDFLQEITWPGQVEIGTGVLRVGNSSITVFQQLFQHGACVAVAENTMVQVTSSTGRATPLTEEMKQLLNTLLITPA